MANQTFPSRIDLWLVALIVGTLAQIAFLAWSLRAANPVGSAISACIIVFVACAGVYAMVPCRYRLGSERLEIQNGRYRDSIAYSDIRKLSRETSMDSAPALSIRRVRIEYRDGVKLVSPRQRDAFISELQRRVDQARQ